MAALGFLIFGCPAPAAFVVRRHIGRAMPMMSIALGYTLSKGANRSESGGRVPEVVAELESRDSTPAQIRVFVIEEIERWKRVVDASGIKLTQ